MTTDTHSSAQPAPSIGVPTGRGLVTAASILVVLFWASAFVVIRWVGDDLTPGALALGRQTVASVILVAIAIWRRPALPRGRSLVLVIVYGVLWFAGYSFVLNLASQHLDAGTTSMIVNIAPLLVAVVAGVVFKEGFPAPLLIGITVSFIGVILIAGGGIGPHSRPIGLVLALLAAVLYASGVLTQKAALRDVDALTATWLGSVIGTIALLPFLPSLVQEASEAPTWSVVGVVYLGVVPSAAAFLLWAWVLKRGTAGGTAAVTLAVPAVAVLLSWVILAELPMPWGVVGGVLCLAGVAWSRRRPRRRQASVR
ncbi:drug/metabolite transporter (DMT)-like permease [Microbacterium ginsengiterrae]|uniref:Drug/metabolite transporter (DMT)-like permease n=1 Tax=Microbacterium ginsengiterrae TaxID=546115 RepID=A0A7W9CEX8_9MICO|nr:drug/metabolite transporter (DMT)-like permease [Microbacterium ginsengiterrae]